MHMSAFTTTENLIFVKCDATRLNVQIKSYIIQIKQSNAIFLDEKMNLIEPHVDILVLFFQLC